jgi:hypothetical protein
LKNDAIVTPEAGRAGRWFLHCRWQAQWPHFRPASRHAHPGFPFAPVDVQVECRVQSQHALSEATAMVVLLLFSGCSSGTRSPVLFLRELVSVLVDSLVAGRSIPPWRSDPAPGGAGRPSLMGGASTASSSSSDKPPRPPVGGDAMVRRYQRIYGNSKNMCVCVCVCVCVSSAASACLTGWPRYHTRSHSSL